MVDNETNVTVATFDKDKDMKKKYKKNNTVKMIISG